MKIVREILPGFGLDPREVEHVIEIILATRLPQTPLDFLGELLSDADLDALGSDTFFRRNKDLRGELATLGTKTEDLRWWRDQIVFVGKHTYFTAAARALRDEGKRENLAAVRRIVKSLERGEVLDSSLRAD